MLDVTGANGAWGAPVDWLTPALVKLPPSHLPKPRCATPKDTMAGMEKWRTPKLRNTVMKGMAGNILPEANGNITR